MTVHYQIDNADFLNYVETIKPLKHPVLCEIEQYNRTHHMGNMMLSMIQTSVLTWLAQLMRVKYYLEIGVYTGYSSTAVGLSLGQQAQLLLCDISVTYTDIARQFWKKAGIDRQVKLFLQPALISLQELAQAQQTVDLALIDADKATTPQYIEAIFPLLRSGGVIAIDNVYLQGKVAAKDQMSASTSIQVMKALNRQLWQDKRFATVMLPLGDGFTLLLKR